MEKGSNTKQKIINTVIDIAATEGIGNVTTKKVAQVGGIAEGTIYRHFTSKDELMLEAYMYILSRLDNRLNKISLEGEDIVAFLYSIWTQTLDYLVENPYHALYMDQFRHGMDYENIAYVNKKARYAFSTLDIIKGVLFSLNSQSEYKSLYLFLIVETAINISKQIVAANGVLTDEARLQFFNFLMRIAIK